MANDEKIFISTSSSIETGLEKHAGPPGTTSSAQSQPSPPPDGGTVAWLQCAGSFFMLFNVWGLLNSFGVYEAFYKTEYLPRESYSTLSWIGSLQGFLLLVGAAVTGPLFDRGYARLLVVLGSVLVVFGMAMTSLCHEYWQVLLAQGVVVGLGSGCLFLPSIAIIPTYFLKKRSSAMGIATAGAGLGAVIYTVIFHQLQPKLGFPWTIRAIALVILVTQLVPVGCMRQRYKPSDIRSIIDKSALREPAFILMGVSVFLAALGLFTPFFYIQLFATQAHIGSASLQFYSLAILNASSCIGRLLPNALADKIGPLNVLIPCTALVATAGFAWIDVHTGPALTAFAVLYGFFAGSFISLGPVVVVATCPRPDVIGTRLGMIFVALAAGVLVGNPIAGALVRGGFEALQLFCGATVMAAAVVLLLVRAALVRGLVVKV